MSKTVFIDFDGTLADHGLVPKAHIRAIQQARTNGHHILLCTGRPKSLVPRELRESVFDGLVCGAGVYVEIDGRVLLDTRFPDDVAARTIRELSQPGITFILEAPQAIWTLTGQDDKVRELFDGALWSVDPRDESYELLAALRTADDLDGSSFGKAVVLESSEIPVDELATEIGPAVDVIGISVQDMGGSSGEIYLRGVNKSAGIALVAQHLGVSRSDIVAVGDGTNDAEMIAYAGTGVVVESASDELLALAQLTIPGPENNGLVEGFSRLGLI